MLDGLGSSIILGGLLVDYADFPTVPIPEPEFIRLFSVSTDALFLYSKTNKQVDLITKSTKSYEFVTKSDFTLGE